MRAQHCEQPTQHMCAAACVLCARTRTTCLHSDLMGSTVECASVRVPPVPARARSKRLLARVCIQWLAVRASASITFRGRIFPGTHTHTHGCSPGRRQNKPNASRIPPNILFQYACAFSARMTHMRERGIDLHNISVGARKTQINESRWSAPCTSYRSCKCTTILNYSALKRLFPRCIRWTFHMHMQICPQPGVQIRNPRVYFLFSPRRIDVADVDVRWSRRIWFLLMHMRALGGGGTQCCWRSRLQQTNGERQRQQRPTPPATNNTKKEEKA